MKLNNLISATLLSTIFLWGCGSGTNKTANEENISENTETMKTDTKKEACVFTYIHDSTQVTWTAYKFESKAGVGGSFKTCEVSAMTQSGDYSQVLNGMEFKIPVSSTYTNNDERDEKIKKHFWAKMANTETITGQIIEVEGTVEKGSLKIKLKMNDMEQTVKGSYTMTADGHISLATELDMTKFGCLDAIASLNKICEDLHREAPGQKSVLWPNVSVLVKGFLKKDCPQ